MRKNNILTVAEKVHWLLAEDLA